jgi:hypothetical protein
MASLTDKQDQELEAFINDPTKPTLHLALHDSQSMQFKEIASSIRATLPSDTFEVTLWYDEDHFVFGGNMYDFIYITRPHLCDETNRTPPPATGSIRQQVSF